MSDAKEPTKQGLIPTQVCLPKITIEYCTQCRWMLRAAYYAQELLSTFGTAIGEISLRPATGGTFVVTIEHVSKQTATNLADEGVHGETKVTLLWNRATDQGFPETKELKRRLRDVIEPGRDLGHVDKHDTKKGQGAPLGQKRDAESLQQAPMQLRTPAPSVPSIAASEQLQENNVCEDCS